MSRWSSNPGTGDTPHDHDAPRTDGGAGDDGRRREPLPIPTNPQTETPGMDDRRHARRSWLRSSLADVAGGGQAPERADIEKLPEAHRDRARAICAEARRLHGEGSQADALEHARAGLMALERKIGKGWRPPAPEQPSADLLDSIQGVVR